MPDREDKTLLDQAWVNQAMLTNPAWHTMRSSHRVYLNQGKSYYVWRSVNGKPKVIREYLVSTITASPTNGLEVILRPISTPASSPASAIVVSSLPKEIPDEGVFLWVPAFADVRHVPKNYEDPCGARVLRVPICLRTKSNPEHEIIEAATYFASVSDFKKMHKQQGL